MTVNSGLQPPFSKTTFPTVPMNLTNYNSARDPTWQQLIDFIATDKTDAKSWVENTFMCGAFAEEVHNNAESVGIKAAVVAIDFTGGGIGHALNAFRTVDRGLVYIDCTGKGLQTTLDADSTGQFSTWDKMAYVAKDREYGNLALSITSSPEYLTYLKEKASRDAYIQKLGAYNLEVEKYNAEIAGKTYFIGTFEWQRVKAWAASLDQTYKELEELRASLADIWEPLGIVSSIEIYW